MGLPMKALGQIVVCIALLAATPVFGQRASRPHSASRRSLESTRLLDRSLGESIVETALHTHPWDYYGSDCSHFVNAIFDAVGLPFRYTNSIDLYDGTDTFHRVFHPQPGDLIVWRGHVGIVVDPAEHSFYSMLRSGLRLASYESPYWRSRGRARFMRYVPSTKLAAHAMPLPRLREGQ